MLKFFILKAMDKFDTFCCAKQNCMVCVRVEIIKNEIRQNFATISAQYEKRVKQICAVC